MDYSSCFNNFVIVFNQSLIRSTMKTAYQKKFRIVEFAKNVIGFHDYIQRLFYSEYGPTPPQVKHTTEVSI